MNILLLLYEIEYYLQLFDLYIHKLNNSEYIF
jgi:hypothetical protein